MRLNRENCNHEVIGEAGVAEEGAVFWITAPQTAKQGNRPERQDQKGNEEVDRQLLKRVGSSA